MNPPSSQPEPHLRCAALSAMLPTWHAMPTTRRATIIRRAEKLHDTLDPAGTFPVDYIAFRLTGYRRDHGDPALLVGDAVQHDLRWIIDALGQTTPLPLTQDDARTAGDWAMRLNVSPRTLRRWRDAGLRWRWLQPDGQARRCVGHTAAAIEHFRTIRPDRFAYAQQFTQIDAPTHDALLKQARQLADASPHRSLSTIAQKLAQQTGRAHETLRQLLEKHDRQHPDSPIFSRRHEPLNQENQRRITRQHRAGTPIARIAADHGKSVGTIHRILLTRRAAVLRRVPLDFVDSPLFARPEADEVFLRPHADASPKTKRKTPKPDGKSSLPPVLQPLFDQPPVPDHAAMRSLFLRYNYLKAKAHRLRAALPPKRKLRAADLAVIEDATRHAGQTRRELVRANLPEMLSIARRQLTDQPDPQHAALLRLLLTAWPALLDAIETFNASGNVPFHRYLRNRLLQRFATTGTHPATPRLATKRESPGQLTDALITRAQNAGVLPRPSPADDDHAGGS